MLSLLVAFAVQSKQAVFTPVLPFGVSPQVSKDVARIAKMTESGDFAGARAALRSIPGRSLNVEWDDSAVAASRRFDYGKQRDLVLGEWAGATTSVSLNLVKTNSDLKVVFIPKGPMELVWSENPSQPRLTIKLAAEADGKTVEPAIVHNEFSYGIGTYLGIAKIPRPGMIMAGVDMTASNPLGLQVLETAIANTTASVCQSVRDAVLRSQVVSSAQPQLAKDPAPVKAEGVLQGTPVRFDLELKNSGAGELAYRVIPDCNCFGFNPPKKNLAPGQTVKMPGAMDTREYPGTWHKTLYLFSNDPTNPVREIPVDVKITPRYHMLPNNRVYVVDGDGATVEAYIFAPADHPLTVKGAKSEGLPGDVTVEAWEGPISDPDYKEVDMGRKGYKVTLKLANIPDAGRIGTNIVLETNDPVFTRINYPVYLQKGIQAMPASVYMGEVGAAPRKMFLSLTRPGRDFKITSIASDSKHLEVSYEAVRPGEYKVTVSYDGQGAKGDYHATISIKTDDPKQPLIEVPVLGMVR